MSDRPTLLLEHHLKELKLPSFLREYGKMAAQCAAEGVDHPQYLLRLAGLELIDRHQRMVGRRIRAARFTAVKSLDTFDFPAITSVNKALVMELARCECIQRRENVIAVGNSGAGKTHLALGLGLAACQRGMSVDFTTAAALAHEIMEAKGREAEAESAATTVPAEFADHRRVGLCTPVTHRGGTALRRSSASATSGAPSWSPPTCPSASGPGSSARSGLTGALLDRLTHHVHILEMNGESCRPPAQPGERCSSRPGRA